MLKEIEMEQEVIESFRKCIEAIPGLKLEVLPRNRNQPYADFVFKIIGKGWDQLIYVETKTLGTPKQVREAVNSLIRIADPRKAAYGIVVAPFISTKTAAICKMNGIGFVDLSGNCYLQFKQVVISIENKANKFPFREGLSSIYAPKSERILRVLLTFPYRGWKVIDLAEEADISLGMISHVGKKLIEEEWAERNSDGISLTKPESLLEDWSKNYTFQRNKLLNYYTLLSVPELELGLGQICKQQGILYALTGFSAANKIAPMVKGQRSMIYLGAEIEKLAEKLSLKRVESGANVVLIKPYDEGVFWKSESIGDVMVANPIQVYLDLKRYPGRGEEAADQILKEIIKTRWQLQKMTINSL